MLDRLLGVKIHHYLHLTGFIILSIGLPFNKVLMSIGTIWGVSNLVLEGNFKQYAENIKNNRIYLILLFFFLLHIFGLAWSSNWDYGLHDLRVKLPLFAIPLALVARPIVDRKEILLLLLAFLLSTLVISIVNMYTFYGASNTVNATEFRSMSLFVSHIRFAILIVISLVISVSFLFLDGRKYWFVFLPIVVWFIIYTYFSQVISGAISLFAAGIFFLFYLIWEKRKIRWSVLLFFFVVGVASVQLILKITSGENRKPFALHEKSALGNAYFNDTTNTSYENGNPIGIHISELELNENWPNYSRIPYEGMNRKNEAIKFTLIRYLTYLNVSKDAEGLKKLSKTDIQNIENGFPTPIQAKGGFIARIETIKNQLENVNDPNGQSLLQRLESWKTAYRIIQSNPLLGVGTGDVQDAFDQEYITSNSKLEPQFRLRAHNMFLTVQLTFGVIGSFIFLSFCWLFISKMFQKKQALALVIFGVIFASFFIEDTLETQTGVTLFTLFCGLFLSASTSVNRKAI